MGDVVGSLTMSLDGYIAYSDGSVGHLFDWYDAADVEVRWPGMGMVSHVDPASAAYLEAMICRVGALVVGRRVYDLTDGWGGDPPFGVPLFLVTHYPPEAWPTPDAPYEAVTEGVAAAIERAKLVAGDKAVALSGPSVIGQALNLGLLDEVVVDMAPVLLGSGIPFFGELSSPPVLLDDPEVIVGTRVTHLRYRVLHQAV
jgi:dihydrofolate reductase